MGMTREERLAELRAKLQAREGRPGTAANVEALKARIASLEQEIADGL